MQYAYQDSLPYTLVLASVGAGIPIYIKVKNKLHTLKA